MKKRFILPVCMLFAAQFVVGQVADLNEAFRQAIADKNLKAGIALCDLSGNAVFSINGEQRFPMQSVFKFPVALTLLRGVDQERWTLNQLIPIAQSQLLPNTWSPLKKKYPVGDIQLPLSEIIFNTVALSDNNGCDILLDMLGGAGYVNEYIHSLGIRDINIVNNEKGLQSSWEMQFNNWVTPVAMIELLRLFDENKLLNPETQNFLWKVMADTKTGSIKNKLPNGVEVVHKTGSSGFYKGVSAATNDVGIMVLPNGNHIAFALFITDSREDAQTNYDVLADFGRIIYEYGMNEPAP